MQFSTISHLFALKLIQIFIQIQTFIVAGLSSVSHVMTAIHFYRWIDEKASEKIVVHVARTRVTRLGEFLPIGRLFTLSIFVKKI
jgi:hypothetical protein